MEHDDWLRATLRLPDAKSPDSPLRSVLERMYSRGD